MLKEILFKVLDKAVKDKNQVNVSFAGDIFNTYYGRSGQRSARIEKYFENGFGDDSGCEHLYKIVRVNSFTNDVDEGTNGAILGTLRLTEIDTDSIKDISFNEVEYTVKFNGITLRFNDNPFK